MVFSKSVGFIFAAFALVVFSACAKNSDSASPANGKADPKTGTPTVQTETRTDKFPIEACRQSIARSHTWSTEGSLTYYLYDYDCYLENIAPPGREIVSATIAGAGYSKGIADLYGEFGATIVAELVPRATRTLRVKFFWGTNNWEAQKFMEAAMKSAQLTLEVK